MLSVSTVDIPIESQKYCAVKVSVVPRLSLVSVFPIISCHSSLGYLFFICPIFCKIGIKAIPRLLTVLIFLLKSGIAPIFANSSRKQNTSLSHLPLGLESAYRTNFIKRNVKIVMPENHYLNRHHLL